MNDVMSETSLKNKNYTQKWQNKTTAMQREETYCQLVFFKPFVTQDIQITQLKTAFLGAGLQHAQNL